MDILTPHKTVASGIHVVSAIVPTQKGQINILEHHTHIITNLEPGILSLFGSSDDPDRHFVVTVGICKVLGNKIYILSQTAEESSSIDTQRAKRAMENAEHILSSEKNLSFSEITKYRNKIERAKLRLQLTGHL